MVYLLSWQQRITAAPSWLIFFAIMLLLIIWRELPASNLGSTPLQAPNISHWFGTDSLGQDVLYRLLRATPNTLLLAFFVGLIPVAIALVLASISVIGPHWVDRIILKITDSLIALPSVLILILIAAIVEPNLWGLILMLSIAAWMDDLRVLRITMQQTKQRESFIAAQSFGAKSNYLLLTHLWPATWSLLPALFIQNARRGVLQSAGIAFLGLTDPRLPLWGNLLQEAQAHIHSTAFWWLLLPPLAAISLLLYSISRLDHWTEKHMQQWGQQGSVQ